MKYKVVESMNTAWDVEEKHKPNICQQQKEYVGEDSTVNQQRDWRDTKVEITILSLMDGGHVVVVMQKDRP